MALTATATSGLTVAFASTTAAVCTVAGSTVTIVSAGNCSITANQAGDGNYQAAPNVVEAFAITQAPQTISFTNPGSQVFSPGGTVALTATATSGLTVAFGSTTAAVCTVAGSTITIVTAGNCSITASQAGDGNYQAAPNVVEAFAITQAPQTISFTNPWQPGLLTRRNGGADSNRNVRPDRRIRINDSSRLHRRRINRNDRGTAGNCSITASQAGNGNYQAAPNVVEAFAITQAPQTISFTNPGSQVFSPGGTVALTATATSGLTVAFASTTAAVCTVAGSTVTIVTAGNCSITASQAGDGNYQAAPNVIEAFAITQAPQTISFTNPGSQVFTPGGTVALTATATSSLTVAFASTTAAVCTVAGSTVTIVSAGNCSIAASQAGNINYQAAPNIVQAFAITPATTTTSVVSSVNPSFQNQLVTFTATVSPALATGTVTFRDGAATLATTAIAGGTATFQISTLAAGSHSITATYNGSTNYSGSVSTTLVQTVTPNGNVILRVVSDVTDGVFPFSSPTAALAVPVTTSGGVGQTGAISLNPGSYAVTISLPTGFGLTGVSCSDSNSTGNVAGRSAAITLEPSETVTCSFVSADTQTKTTQAIARFLKRRNDLLLSSEPSSDRQIERLRQFASGGNNSGGTGGSNLNNAPSALGGPSNTTLSGATSPFNSTSATPGSPSDTGSRIAAFAAGAGQKTGPTRAPLAGDGFAGSASSGGSSPVPGVVIALQNAQTGSFSFSLHDARKEQRAKSKRQMKALLGEKNYAKLGANNYLDHKWKPLAFDIWAEGKWTYFDDETLGSEAQGHFGVVYLGADYVINSSLLVGALVQYDRTKETSDAQSTRIEGRGWMVGPYATLRLAPNVYFQGRAAWGKSKNDISPFMTYTDTFDTTRWLVRGKLQGNWSFGALQFSPSASVAYIEEHQKSYTDTLGVVIPDQTATLGQAEFGPELSYRWKLNNGHHNRTVDRPERCLELH